jgi:hypothetical protein
MVDSVLINNTKISAADTVTNVYTSPAAGSGTIITAFTVSNSSASSASYKAYIVDSGGVVGAPVIPLQIVVKDKSDSGPAIVNQVVPASGTIRVENSTGDALNFYATGRAQ